MNKAWIGKELERRNIDNADCSRQFEDDKEASEAREKKEMDELKSKSIVARCPSSRSGTISVLPKASPAYPSTARRDRERGW